MNLLKYIAATAAIAIAFSGGILEGLLVTGLVVVLVVVRQRRK